MSARLWVFLPTYNEVENLEAIVRATAGQLEAIMPGDWRVLVVDDNSPDGTGALAERLQGEMAGVEALRRPAKEGLGRAYLAGFRHALRGGAELVVVMDADFSHDPAHLPAMIRAAETSDLVLGSRYVPGGRIENWPRLRRVLSRSGSVYARAILGVRVHDLTSGFRCVRRSVLETVEPSTLRAQGYVFNIELTYRTVLAGFTVTEVPITFRDREEGVSKMSLPIAVEALLLVPKLRSVCRDAVQRPPSDGARQPLRRVRWRSARWPRRREGVLSLPGADPAGDGTASANGDEAASEARPRTRG